MTKAGQKLINAAKEALKIARCDHDLVPQASSYPSVLNRFYCPKCGGMFVKPREEQSDL